MKCLSLYKRFKNSNNDLYEYSFSYFYDHDWRPTYTEMKVGGTVQRLNTMQYNELSQLETKYLHGDATDYLQRQDYAYNIRGWLTGINNIFQGSSGVFAQKLYYNTVPQGTSSQATARYNGNISASEWRVSGITPSGYNSGYVYDYDALNRLTKAAYFKRNMSSSVIGWDNTTTASKYNYGLVTSVGTLRGINYDKNGNIKTLSRLARRSSDTDIVLFDSLSYTYNGNRIKGVSDAISGQNTLGDFPGMGQQASETFFYDASGNLTKDDVRGIQLTYNHMNMPLTILSNEGSIENTYAWDGTKRRRLVLDSYEQLISDECYYGDLVVENGQPMRILHAAGYVDVSGMAVFNYQLKDHLGNVRAVIGRSYGPGAYTFSQASDYYPFGMAFTWNAANSEEETYAYENKYKYNGKEEQPMPGKWLDYGARFYDAQLGRWHSVDPLAEEYYSLTPYNYCANNPINFIDPDGRSMDAITSSFITPDGTLIEHRDDGDPKVYLVRDPDAWRKNGSKKEDAEHVGYEYPGVDYASQVGQKPLYYPSKSPYFPGWLNDGPIEEDYTLESLFIPVFGWLKCVKFGGKFLWGFWDDFAKVTYKGKTYAKVGGRLYSRHAIDRMVPSALGKAAGGTAGRSVSTNIVEEVIKNGNRTTRLVDGIVRTEHVLGDVHVITEEAGKVVVTVITK